jgi:type I restriction enzyme M protein
VALPGQLFFSTQIPVCLWFLTRNKNDGKSRNRKGETLFIDARKMGVLIDRVHRELTNEDIAKIADTYHAWKSNNQTLKVSSTNQLDGEQDESGKSGRESVEKTFRVYKDIPGFCKSSTLKEIQEQGYVLTPGRYVGAADLEEDDEPFEQKMARLKKELEAQFEESDKLQNTIRASINKLTIE